MIKSIVELRGDYGVELFWWSGLILLCDQSSKKRKIIVWQA